MKKLTFIAIAVAAMAFASCQQKPQIVVVKSTDTVYAENTAAQEAATSAANDEAIKTEAKEAIRSIFSEVLSTFSRAYNGSGDYDAIEAVAERHCSDSMLAQVMRDNRKNKAEYDAEYPNDEGPGFDEAQAWQYFVGEGSWTGCELGPCSVKSVTITSCEGNVVSFKVIEKVAEPQFKTTTYCTGQAEKQGDQWVITSLHPEKCL